MTTMMRAFALMLMMLLPGGLMLLALVVITRVLAEGMRREQGSSGHRLARSFASIRWPDVWRQTRAFVR